jgi:hypothetical protein
MTKTYYPFDAGAGASIVEAQWAKMAASWQETGVFRSQLNMLEPFGDSSGMVVKVKSGQAWIKGFFFESDAQESLNIGASDPTNPRIDVVVARLDKTANTIDFVVVAGTPAADPAIPAITDTATVTDMPLAYVNVLAGVSTITAGNVYDIRRFSYEDNRYGDGADGDVTISTTITLTRDMNYNNLTVTSSGILKPAGYKVYVRGYLWIKSGGSIQASGTNGGNGDTSGNGGAAGTGAPGAFLPKGTDGTPGHSMSGGGGSSFSTAKGLLVQPIGSHLWGAGSGGSGGGATGQALSIQPTDVQSTVGFRGGMGGTPTSSSNTRGGGGGGGGAGMILIHSNVWNNLGTVQCKGGDGGVSGGPNEAGGGGGGAGGQVTIFYRKAINPGTIQVTGGIGNTSGPFDGTNGQDGVVGFIAV